MIVGDTLDRRCRWCGGPLRVVEAPDDPREPTRVRCAACGQHDSAWRGIDWTRGTAPKPEPGARRR